LLRSTTASPFFTDRATEDTVAALIQETESDAHAAGEGLQATVSRLRERLTELRTAKEDERRRAAYEEAWPSATNRRPSSPASTRLSPRS
jgi:hypothetical protein